MAQMTLIHFFFLSLSHNVFPMQKKKKKSKEIILPVHRYLDLESHFVESVVIHLRYICPNGPLNEQMRIELNSFIIFVFVCFCFCLLFSSKMIAFVSFYLEFWNFINKEIVLLSASHPTFSLCCIFCIYLVYSFISIRFNEIFSSVFCVGLNIVGLWNVVYFDMIFHKLKFICKSFLGSSMFRSLEVFFNTYVIYFMNLFFYMHLCLIFNIISIILFK